MGTHTQHGVLTLRNELCLRQPLRTFLSTRNAYVSTNQRPRRSLVCRCDAAEGPEVVASDCSTRSNPDASKPLEIISSEVQVMQGRLESLVQAERFEEACTIRDSISTLNLRKRMLEIHAAPQLGFRVGDVVVHRRYGYRGVIYGHDNVCTAPQSWQEAMKVDHLPHGAQQPFYHVLVDCRDRPGGSSTYVAEENLMLQRAPLPIAHPFVEKFFVALTDGTYVPGKKLRDAYPDDW